jgi:hypothetical protein
MTPVQLLVSDAYGTMPPSIPSPWGEGAKTRRCRRT